MGEADEGSLRVAVQPEEAGALAEPIGHDPKFEDSGNVVAHSLKYAAGRRRFTVAAIAAIAATGVPFIWILWSLWGPTKPLRPSNYQDNFYDLQTRAMFHGHLSLANGALGLEGFLHDGRTYTYFGLFPSIIRMPVMLFTNSLDGKLTAPYMLAAWLLTGLFASLLLWRVRFLIRGDAAMGRVEAGAFGVLIATIMGGTIWMLLAATPFVFNEDIAWSVCLTVGSIFALLGIIERPSWSRVIVSGILILCANLDRSTTGWACVVGAGFIAVWFGLGLGGRENRRWFVPVLAAGLVPLAIGCAVNYSKFGVLFGVSNFEQVWTHVNAYRRQFLAANHNAEEGTIFVPTNVVAYLRPDGIRFTSVFPFITLPSAPPRALSGVLFDRRYRTASLPASSPLLFLLGVWGLVTAFRPRPIGRVALTRLLLLAAGAAGAALMLWGYIAPRYLGDFVPFLVLAGAVAMADIWRRLEGRKRSLRVGALGVIAIVALYSIAANIGIAITPNEEWETPQVLHYVEAQKAVSDLTGHPLNAQVVRGNSLPPWGPADQLYVIGDCNGLYISNGENYSTVPSQEYARTTWMTVELGHGFEHTFAITVHRPRPSVVATVPLVTTGASTVNVMAAPHGTHGEVQLTFELSGQGQLPGRPLLTRPGSIRRVVVITDTAKHVVTVTINGTTYLSTTMTGRESVRPDLGKQNANGTLSVVDETPSTPGATLCQSLVSH